MEHITDEENQSIWWLWLTTQWWIQLRTAGGLIMDDSTEGSVCVHSPVIQMPETDSRGCAQVIKLLCWELTNKADRLSAGGHRGSPALTGSSSPRCRGPDVWAWSVSSRPDGDGLKCCIVLIIAGRRVKLVRHRMGPLNRTVGEQQDQGQRTYESRREAGDTCHSDTWESWQVWWGWRCWQLSSQMPGVIPELWEHSRYNGNLNIFTTVFFSFPLSRLSDYSSFHFILFINRNLRVIFISCAGQPISQHR